jgi:Zn-dependent protease with chaperone function
MRAVACLAVAGAIPLTVGAILWVIAAARQGLASARGWGGTAAAGEVLVLAGLACGLAMIIMAARWQRRTPRSAAAGAAGTLAGNGPALMALASPERHASLTGPAGMPVYPQPPAAYPQPPAAYPQPPAGYPQPGPSPPGQARP